MSERLVPAAELAAYQGETHHTQPGLLSLLCKWLKAVTPFMLQIHKCVPLRTLRVSCPGPGLDELKDVTTAGYIAFLINAFFFFRNRFYSHLVK